MKICHVTTVHSPADIRIFHKMCVSLVDAGHEVSLLVAGHGVDHTEKGVQIIMVPVNYGSRLVRILRAPAILARRAVEIAPDVVHFHDPEMMLCVNKLLRNGIRVVYDVHEDVPRQVMAKYWIPKPFRKIISRLVEWYENRKAAQVDQVITATPHIAKRFLAFNDHTIDVCNYPMTNELVQIVPKISQPTLLCYIGAITPIRGAVEMVQAVENLPARLVMAGPVQSDGLLDQLKKMPGSLNTSYPGKVNRQQLVEILSDARAGLSLLHPVPNYIDALPTKIFEYMLAGIPFIASDFPAIKEIVSKWNCGICVNPLDVVAIKQAALFLLNNPEQALEMGQRGRNAAIENFNWEKEKVKLLEVYQKFDNKNQQV